MKGDFHVRFRENVRVKFPRVTRLASILNFTNFKFYRHENFKINNRNSNNL